jgi:hypothetical protein
MKRRYSTIPGLHDDDDDSVVAPHPDVDNGDGISTSDIIAPHGRPKVVAAAVHLDRTYDSLHFDSPPGKGLSLFWLGLLGQTTMLTHLTGFKMSSRH